jgi:hypothetical protein
MLDTFETRTSTFDIGPSPDDGRKFTELYNVQHLQRSQREAVRHRREARRVDSRERINQSAQLDRVSRVCISTIQRLYSMACFFFWLNKQMPQGQFTRGDRQRFIRIQRSVWNDLRSALAI